MFKIINSDKEKEDSFEKLLDSAISFNLLVMAKTTTKLKEDVGLSAKDTIITAEKIHSSVIETHNNMILSNNISELDKTLIGVVITLQEITKDLGNINQNLAALVLLKDK